MREREEEYSSKRELRKQVQQLKSIYAAVPALITVFNLKTGEYLYVNDAVRSLLGYTKYTLYKGGLRFAASLVHPEDIQKITDQNIKALERANKRTGARKDRDFVTTLEYRFLHKTGSYRWLHTDGCVFSRDKNGDAECMLNVSVDITKQKEAEFTAVKRSSAILESITDAFFAIDREFKFIYVNKQAEKLLLHKRKELIGKSIWEMFPAARDSEFYHQYIHALVSGKAVHFDEYYPPLDKYFEVHAYPSAEGLAVYFSDISYKKHSEEELRRSENRLRKVIESDMIGILFWNLDGKIIDANNAFLRTFGYTRQDLRENKIHWGAMTPPEYAEVDRKGVQELIDFGTMTPFEKEYIHKNGKRIPVLLGASMLDTEKKEGVAFVLDITQRKELEKQKDDFIGIASHELKTPVTSIKAYTQVLQRRFTKAGNQDSAQLLQKMNEQLDRLSNLVKDLLDITKIESGKLQLKRETFSINDLITESIEEVQRITYHHKITYESGEDVMITGDRDRLGQVLSNLLSNAIKYSPQADTVIVTSQIQSERVVVSVQDFGVGIPEDKRQKIFERFFRINDDQQESFPGLGLGLYISAETIKRHKGTIWVESEIGTGTTFYFSLPLNSSLA